MKDEDIAPDYIQLVQSVFEQKACTLYWNIVHWRDFLPTPTGSAVCVWRHILVFHFAVLSIGICIQLIHLFCMHCTTSVGICMQVLAYVHMYTARRTISQITFEKPSGYVRIHMWGQFKASKWSLAENLDFSRGPLFFWPQNGPRCRSCHLRGQKNLRPLEKSRFSAGTIQKP